MPPLKKIVAPPDLPARPTHSQVITVTGGTLVFVAGMTSYHRVADERFKYLQRDLPTSALIGVRRLSQPDLMVEIEAMAVIPAGRV